MTAFTATFSNGQTISLKNSNRANTHAWQASIVRADGRPVVKTGWSGSEALATKAARATAQLAKPQWWDRVRDTRGTKFVPDTVTVEIVPAVAQ